MKTVLGLAFIFLVIWAVSFGFVYSIGYLGLGQERLDALTNFGIQSRGKVVAKQPQEHRTVIYSYRVSDVDWTGVGRAGRGNPEFDELVVGQDVAVYYDPQNPADSILGDPRPLRDSGGIFLKQVAIVLSLIPAIGITALVFALVKIRSKSGPG